MGASLSNKTRSRGRRTGGSYRPLAEINVTPMVDVMLVLLIIFMVSAPLLTSGVDIELPSSKAKALQTEDNKPIEISIDTDGHIYFMDSKEPMMKTALISTISAMMEGDEERRIYIRADKSIDYGRVMEILGILNSAGFSKVALLSERKN